VILFAALRKKKVPKDRPIKTIAHVDGCGDGIRRISAL
jgi:hypothetical protein